jgi:type VI secretion system protein ImpK
MPAQNAEPDENRPTKSARADTLAILYQSVFTIIVRLQSGRQRLNDFATFRRRINDALQDVQKDAAAAGYRSRETRSAESAVVAFLDEAVLSLKDPSRDAWAKQTLSLELYSESNAGEVFYEHLDELIGETDSSRLADLLEVYLLCLLLGFEGKFSGAMRVQATLMADRLRGRIEAIRGSGYRLSPAFRFAEDTAVLSPPERNEAIWKWRLASLLAAPVILFLLFKIYLSMRVDALLQAWR